MQVNRSRFRHATLLFTLAACDPRSKARDLADAAPMLQSSAPASPLEAGLDASARADAGKSLAREAVHAFVVFEGKVDKKVDFRLALDRLDTAVEGIVQVAGNEVSVRGSVTDGRRLSLTAVGSKGRAPVTFSGEMDGSLLRGEWRDPKAKKPGVVAAGPPNPFPAKADATFESTYRGVLGTRIRIRAKLQKRDDKISGVYRYARSKEDLTLAGKVDSADGAFELTESNASGARTGTMRGVFLDRTSIFGRWTSPDGARSFPVTMSFTSGYPAIFPLAQGGKVVPQEEALEGNKFCSVSLTYPELVGSAAKAKEKPVNDALRASVGAVQQEECATATEDSPFQQETTYSVTGQRNGFVGFKLQFYFYTGGAHGNHGFACPLADLSRGSIVSLRPSMLTPAGRRLLDARVTSGLRDADPDFAPSEASVSDITALCFEGSDLVVQFQVYEVGPYAIGAPTVRIPGKEAYGLFEKNEIVEALFGPKK